jgi:ribA/ribD-fused uncharacterized protein
MTEPITSFTGEFFFLSNFYVHEMEVDGDVYWTVEHAFQAMKTDDPDERRTVQMAATAAAAKHAGQRVTLRPDWDTKRFEVMERLVRLKFNNRELQLLLLATDDRELIEGNTINDYTWGCVKRDGVWIGRNELGKILMRLRAELDIE